MKAALLLLSLLMVTKWIETKDCKEKSIEENCTSTNYKNYVDCLTERHRRKRSTNCDSSCENNNSCATSCDECDCNTCNNCEYSNSCSNCCSSCCQTSSCTTNHCCHKYCHASCRTSTCRSSCRQSCTNQVKTLYVQGNGSSPAASYSRNASIVNTNEYKHNITTVIHLRNVINNTNVIDAPIKINTTNYNNITVPNFGTSQTVISGNTSGRIVEPNCCTVLSPRQCVREDKFPFIRCFHYRYKMCGQMCYSQIIHGYQNQQQISYVPQPRPSCAYTNYWPYVACGRPQQPNCAGCYGHHFGQQKTPCNSFCYDDGFGAGPYYRQGPFYQPGYSFAPPCYQMGTCNGYGGFPGYAPSPYGFYGNPYVSGYNNMGFPAPMPAVPAQIGMPAFGSFGGSAAPLPVYRQDFSTTGSNYTNLQNISLSSPIQEDEPFLYNNIAFPSGNFYPSTFNMDNVSHDPRIQADVGPRLNNTYAEIKILGT